MKTIKPWHLFEQDDGEEPKAKGKAADVDPHSIVTMPSIISKSKKAKEIMNSANSLFNSGKYYDAFKQYKNAQIQDPSHFWAFYNAASSAYNARTRQSIKLIPAEIEKAKAILNNWEGDAKEKGLAIKKYQLLLRTIRQNTDLNL